MKTLDETSTIGHMQRKSSGPGRNFGPAFQRLDDIKHLSVHEAARPGKVGLSLELHGTGCRKDSSAQLPLQPLDTRMELGQQRDAGVSWCAGCAKLQTVKANREDETSDVGKDNKTQQQRWQRLKDG